MNVRFSMLFVAVVAGGLFVGAFAASRTAFPQPTVQSGSFVLSGAGSAQGGAGQSGGQGAATTGQGQGAAPVFGPVASVDGDTLTVTTRQGDTRVKVAGARIQKTVDATADDLKAGEQVVVVGQQGSDGSFTASTIQIRPADAGGQAGFQGQRQGQGAGQAQGQAEGAGRGQGQTQGAGQAQSQGGGQGQARGQGQAQGMRSLFGSVDSLEGDTLALKSQQGETTRVKITGARIEKTADGTAADLKAGVTVTVTGQRGSDGTVSASSVQIMPAGAPGSGSSQAGPTATPAAN